MCRINGSLSWIEYESYISFLGYLFKKRLEFLCLRDQRPTHCFIMSSSLQWRGQVTSTHLKIKIICFNNRYLTSHKKLIAVSPIVGLITPPPPPPPPTHTHTHTHKKKKKHRYIAKARQDGPSHHVIQQDLTLAVFHAHLYKLAHQWTYTPLYYHLGVGGPPKLVYWIKMD